MRQAMKSIFWILQAAVFYLLTLAAALLPTTTTDRFGALIGRLLFRFIPIPRAIAIDYIRHNFVYHFFCTNSTMRKSRQELSL